jgi:hypothetical protein
VLAFAGLCWPLLASRIAEKAMAKQDETLRWQFLLDEDRWESRDDTLDLLDPQSKSDKNPASRTHSARLWTLTVSALFLAGIATLFWLWRDAQAGLDIVQDELTAAIELEIWADEQGDRQLALGLLDEQADSNTLL